MSKIPGTSKEIKALAFGSEFILNLSEAWGATKAETHILTRYVVAGSDAMVSSFSALGPTWNKNYEVVVGKGHKSLVKPSSDEDQSFKIAERFVLSERSPANFTEDDLRAPFLRYKRIELKESTRFFFGAQALRFIGRDKEMASLHKFLGNPQQPFQWTVLYGSGGVGKSRLALELSLSLKDDWHAGFLDENAEKPNWPSWQPMLPTLIVIDYAAKDTENVAQILSALSARGQLDGTKPLNAPVRVILIERTGEDGDWYDRVIGTGEHEHRVTSTRLLPGPGIHLTSVEDPWLLIESCLTELEIPLPDKEQTIEELYRIDPEGRPLFAHFLADAIAEGSDISSLDADRLLQDVINRSRDKFWVPAGARQPEERLLACATIAGGIAISDVLELETDLFPAWKIDRHPQIFSVMTGKVSNENVDALEPDIVGEAFALDCLSNKYLTHTNRKRMIDLAWQNDSQATAQFLFRAHHDFPYHPMLKLFRKAPDDYWGYSYWFKAVVDIIDDIYLQDPEIAEELFCAAELAASEMGGGPMLRFLVREEYPYNSGRLKLAKQIMSAFEKDIAAFTYKTLYAPLHHFSYFLEGARKQNKINFVEVVYSELKKYTGQLVKNILTHRLGDVGVFLDQVRSHGYIDLADLIYDKLKSRTEQLTENAIILQVDQVGTLSQSLVNVGSFLDRARSHGHKELADLIYEGLKKKTDRLTENALDQSLEHVGSFLDCARSHGHKELADLIYEGLKKKTDRLTENALEQSLKDVGSFLDCARSHGHKELADLIYEGLKKKTDRLTENALDQSLEHVGSFLARARSHGHEELVETIWLNIAKDVGKLASRIQGKPPKLLMLLLITIPNDLTWIGEAVAARLKVADFEFGSYPTKGTLAGGCGLALKLNEFGRNDIEKVLINNILRRNNPSDFSDPGNSLLEIAKLLYIAEDNQEPVLSLVQNVCTKSWLNRCVSFSRFRLLASALSLIAVHQSPQITSLFWCPALRRRLSEAIAYLNVKNGEELSTVVQYIGACNLSGLRMPRLQLSVDALEKIGNLPSEILPNESDHVVVERWQRQLWLGLRVIASLSSQRIPVDPLSLNETIKLWKANIDETLSEPDQTPHKINLSMVKWLDNCVRFGSEELVASKELLWCLSGFPRNPTTLQFN